MGKSIPGRRKKVTLRARAKYNDAHPVILMTVILMTVILMTVILMTVILMTVVLKER